MKSSGHVRALLYRLDTWNQYDEDVTPVTADNEGGEFLLSNGMLNVVPRMHYETVADARVAIEPFLRAWEFEHTIREGFSSFRFAFLRVETSGAVLDIDQQLPEQLRYEEHKEEPSGIVIVNLKYPDFPRIRVTADMEIIWERFEAARSGIGEQLQSCAYHALTVVERSAGGRRAAAHRYGIPYEILHKLGELTTARGDPRTARKALPSGATPLTRKEERWIDIAVRYLLLQLGLVVAGRPPLQISMSDLPSLFLMGDWPSLF